MSYELAWEAKFFPKVKRPTLRNSHNVVSDSENNNVYLFGGRSKGGSNNHLYKISRTFELCFVFYLKH